MIKKQRTAIRFTIATAAYLIFAVIPATAPTNPTHVLADGACAAFALVVMIAEAVRGSGWSRVVAVLLALPPLAFLIIAFVAAVSGGLIPADA